MRLNIFVVVLATFGLHIGFNVAYAYPPSYSNEPPAVNDSGGNDDDDGGYAVPQFNFGYAPQQEKQQYTEHNPSVTYFTTSKTSSTSTSPSSGASSAPSQSTLSQATSGLLPAYVYNAEVPTEPEANKVVNAVKLASSTTGQSSLSNAITNSNSNSSEKDHELSKKIIGSSIVSSVSVILNGNEPEFTDALGQKVPKPQPSLQVASPIDLLNPDRYEFYTFDEHGELVKRLMTMEEVQSIVANGDGEGPTIIHHGPIEDRDPEKNVQDIVNSVQSVLNKEVESNKNTTTNTMPIFDTPDVSSSWSMILPAIFGNTGEVDIFPQQKPPQIVMTPDTEVIETSTEVPASTTTKKPKPNKRKPGQKRKTTTSTTEMTPQVIQEELESHESVYTGMQQYQNLAASMQNYDGFSQLHMQPIYHKLPEIETTTRRVFINNQEVVKKPATSGDDEVKLGENFGKKPTTVQHKPIPPHRIKKPNEGHATTKRPQGTKQKIKRKPTTTTTTAAPTTTVEAVTTTATPITTTTSATTTSTTTTTTVAPTTTTTTTTVAPTTTTTTTTVAPTTTTTTTTAAPTTTTTTTTTPQPEPVTSTTTESEPQPSSSTSAPKKKKKKKPTRRPIHSSTTSTHGSSSKPHLSGEKRKPSPKPHRPRPTHHTKYPETTTQSDLTAEGSAHQEVSHNKHQQVTHHRPRPRPHKHTTTTTTTTPQPEATSTTVMFSPVPFVPITPNPIEMSLVVQEFPGYQPSINHNNADVLTTKITTKKPEEATLANTQPTPGTSGYPVPSYGITIDLAEDTVNNQYKKQPLPSLALTHHSSKPYEQDIHTLQSFDQIMQTLKQPEPMAEKIGDEIAMNSKNHTLIKPVKYDSAENEDQLEEIANKHKISVQNAIIEKPTTTQKPLYVSYGGSTLATTMIDFETTTDSSSSEETTFSDENNTPVVVITARPHYLVTTKRPEEITTTKPAVEEENKEIETTELPSYTPFIEVAEDSTIVTEEPDTTTFAITEMEMEQTTESSKTQQDYLYVQEPQTIVHEMTTETPDQTTSNYWEKTTTEIQKSADETTEELQIETRLPVTESNKVDTTISDEREVYKPVLVADLKPQLNMEVIKPSEQISMSDFQTQAATVASTLVDGTYTIAADYSMMSSNETKDEIAFLMSDVIKQISNDDNMSNIEQSHANDNRYSNQAQLDISFLMTPNKNDAPKPNLVASYDDEQIPEDQKVSYNPIHERLEDSDRIDEQSESINKEQAEKISVTPEQETSTLTFTQQDEFMETTTTVPGLATYEEDIKTSEETSNIEQMMTTTVNNMHNSESIEDFTTIAPKTENFQNENSSEIKESENDYENNASTPASEEEETTHLLVTESDDESTTFKMPIEKETTDLKVTESDDESTTFKMPILSLSEIYAQQQNLDDNDHREALFEADSLLDTTTLINNWPEETTDSTIPTTTIKNNDETKMPDNYATDVSLTSESLTIDEHVTESFENNDKSEQEENTDSINENKAGEVQMTTELSTETSEEDKIDTSEFDTATIKVESAEGQEVFGDTDQVTDTTEALTSKYEDSGSTEQGTLQTIEDSETNASDLELQQFTEAVTESTVQKDEINSENFELAETTTQLISSIEYNKPEATVEDSIDIQESPETTTIVYQMSEETSAELNAMISEEDETGESVDEDAYIKLGETTTPKADPTSLPQLTASVDLTESVIKPIISSEDDSKPEQIKDDDIKSTELSEDEEHMLAPPKPITFLIDNDSPTGTQPSMLMGNYGQPFEEADEEDEDDQFGYQSPKLPIPVSTTTTTTTTTTTSTTTAKPIITTTKRLSTLKPVSYYNKQPAYALFKDPVEPLYNKQPSLASYVSQQQQETVATKVATYSMPTPQQRPMQRPPQLSNLMIASTQATRPPVKLEPSPINSKGLEASLANLDEDILEFAGLCNELAFAYWKSITSEKISSARSLVISPFALTSMLSMVFLGARGSTSGEMNDVLKLDDMVTFNPHLVFKNITDSVEKAMDSDIATTAFVREIFSDRTNGKILQFFKEKTQQLYAGHVEEVNFHVVNDIIRRRTNLLVKRHTMGKVLEYLRTNSVWVNGPLATISANLFQTDCSHGFTNDRDGEIFFQVHPTVRQRRLVPIPAVLFKSGFTAGYEPNLDATVVAFGRIQDTTSMIYVMPGHLSSISPSDNLDRLEKELMETAISMNAWSNLLTSLMDRPGMEVQLPRFSHRSFVNATLGLQKMGLKGLFKSDYADLGGLTGSSNRDIYLSDMIQINTFSTCGEEKIADHHHVEMYPAPPLRKRNKDVDAHDDDDFDSSEAIIDFGSLVQDSALGRGFYDDLLDPKYLELPLPLRPRQARVPDSPRLKFDKPFLYFVRHNPTGMILFMGRFNPRLLP